MDTDLSACNTKSEPDKVAPTALEGIAIEGTRIRVTLAPASWNAIRLARE
jgi:alpha-N-arabinofuranosidase